MIKLGKETLKRIETLLDTSEHVDVILRRHDNKLTIDTKETKRRYIGTIYKE